MPALPTCRDDQYGVFSSAQARRSGLSRHAVQHLIESGTLLALRRGVYVEARAYGRSTANDQSRARGVAACLAHTGSVISHHSAALVHALPLLGSRPVQPALTVASAGGRSGCRFDVVIHAAALPFSHVECRGTWAVTTAARTVCDLARERPLLVGLVAVDAALNRALTTERELWRVADGCESWPGSQRLLTVLRRAHGGAESPYETVARWHLGQAGIAAVPQVWAYDDRGPIGSGDLWLPRQWTFLEVDGDVKYGAEAEATTLLDEKRRQERLENAGFGVARVAARDARNPIIVTSRAEQGATRGRLARAAGTDRLGYVGPPPPWAVRGTPISIAHPPDSTPLLAARAQRSWW